MNGGAVVALRSRPSQRLRAQAVLTVSAQLIRGAGSRCEPDMLTRLMGERRRLLRDLRNGIACPHELGCFEAMQTAVEESDRALRRIIENQVDGGGECEWAKPDHTKVSTP